MNFLISVTGCVFPDFERNIEIRTQLNIYNLNKEIQKYNNTFMNIS
jgi:hypothetical protein